jgi:PST family polysaccharide transporter
MFRSPVARNAGLLIAAKVAGYVFPLVMLPLLTRPLGPAAYGELVFATSLVIFFYLLTEYGSQVNGTRAISMCRDDDSRTSEIFSRVIVFRLLLCLVGYGLLWAYSAIQGYPADRFLRLSLAYLITVGEAINPSWYFMGREIPLGLAVSTLGARAVTLPLIPLLVRSSEDANIAVFLVTLPWLLGGVFSLSWALRTFRFSFVLPSIRSLAAELRGGLSAALSGGAASINQPLTVVLLGGAASAFEVGTYGSAVTIIAASKQVLMPLSQLAYARTSFMEARDPGGALKARTRAVLWICAGGVIVSLGLVVAAPIVTTVLFGRAYESSAHLIRLMALVPLLFIAGQALSTQFLFSSGRGRLVVLSMFCGNLACVGACLALVRVSGASGASLSLLLGEAVAAALMAWAAVKARGGLKESQTSGGSP